ncbi:unnamed protein product, partial [Amoebophrya sp. A120]
RERLGELLRPCLGARRLLLLGQDLAGPTARTPRALGDAATQAPRVRRLARQFHPRACKGRRV